jgi:ubiquinone/menaquinone biosynthesis C-methylase UbiE
MEFILAGEKLHRCRVAFLDEIPTARKILLLGEGNGRGLVESRRRFVNAQITCLDASEQMLAQTRRRLTRHNLETDNVEFVHADVLNWEPGDKTYDLIVTNFFLDCFRADHLEQIISQLGKATTPDASWLIADFQTPPAGLQRIRSQLILWMMYAFFRGMTQIAAQKLTAPDSFLERIGFKLHCRTGSEWGLLHSDWWKRECNGLREVQQPRGVTPLQLCD